MDTEINKTSAYINGCPVICMGLIGDADSGKSSFISGMLGSVIEKPLTIGVGDNMLHISLNNMKYDPEYLPGRYYSPDEDNSAPTRNLDLFESRYRILDRFPEYTVSYSE